MTIVNSYGSVYMKNKKIIIIIGIIIVILTSSIIYILNNKTNDNVIAFVNGEKILLEKLEYAKNEYENFTEDELLEALILESLVLEKAKEYNITVSTKEIEEKLKQVEQMGETIKNKILEKYGNFDNYSVALSNKLIYNKVKEIKYVEFCECLKFNEKSINKDVELFIKKNEVLELTDKAEEEMQQQLIKNYYDSLFNVQFEIWKYSLLDNADIDMKNNFSYPNLTSHLNSEKSKTISLEELPYFYKVYFSMNSDEVLDKYSINILKTIPIKNYYDRYLFMEFNVKEHNKKIELAFDIDVGKKVNSVMNSNKKIQIKGMMGEIYTYKDEKNQNIVELNIFDSQMNAYINVKGYNAIETEVLDFVNEFIRVQYL